MTRFIAAALLAGTTIASPAAAAPLLFDFVSENSMQSVSFVLDSNPTPFGLDLSFARFTPILANTPSGPFNATILFYTPTSDGGFDIYNASTFDSVARVSGAQLFSGTTQVPIFSTGSYKLKGLSNLYSDGTLTISAVNAAVPEPATWAMMILGMGAVGYAMRRRQKVTAKVRFA